VTGVLATWGHLTHSPARSDSLLISTMARTKQTARTSPLSRAQATQSAIQANISFQSRSLQDSPVAMLTSVTMTWEVHFALATHALSTERHEILGLLLGSWTEENGVSRRAC
jgi:hypothetical protein